MASREGERSYERRAKRALWRAINELSVDEIADAFLESQTDHEALANLEARLREAVEEGEQGA